MRAEPIALWVVPVGAIGGAARHILDAARVGIPGWRLVTLCPEGELADALRALGRPVVTGELGPEFGVGSSVRTLRRTVHTLRPRIVHTHLAYADIVAALALSAGRLRHDAPRLVSTEHGIAPDDRMYHGSRAKSSVMAAAHRARTSAFDALIAVSSSTREVMLAKWRPRTPISVIYNGVDRPPPSTPTPGLRVVSLARLAPEKGIDRLLDAFALVHREHPEATLVVAGTGPLEADLRARAERVGLGEVVEFPGFVDAAALLATSDVVVQLSVWENCSYTLLDACAAGVGVVATPVGGNPEILPAHCLVDPESTAAVAETILTQALDLSRRPGLGEWPTVAAMTDRLADAYRRVIA